MASSTHRINTETYQRTADIFRNKRNSLPPERLKLLATEVLERLVALQYNQDDRSGHEVSEQDLGAFCDVLLQPSPEAALVFISDRRAKGVSAPVLRFGYIAGAARVLGTRWERDEASFFDVTAAVGHLYAVMRAMGSQTRPEGVRVRLKRRAFFALVPGETHSLGISLAAETFRDDGWDITLRVADPHDSLVRLASEDKPAVIGLSFSTTARLSDLIRLVLALRIVTPATVIGVAPPLKMSDSELLRLVDIDLVFRHAQRALADVERLMHLRD